VHLCTLVHLSTLVYTCGLVYTRLHSCTCVHLYVGLAKTIYIRCIYGILGRETTKYTVIYGVYIRFWPTQLVHLSTFVYTCVHLCALESSSWQMWCVHLCALVYTCVHLSTFVYTCVHLSTFVYTCVHLCT